MEHPHKNDHIFPSRYAYFRDGDLYLLGYPILKSTDPELALFNEVETKKKQSFYHYHPFIDEGAPLNQDGTLNIEKIKGTPSLIFWPIGERFAFPPQSFIPFLSCPNITVYILGIIALAVGTYFSKRKNRFPITFENNLK